MHLRARFRDLEGGMWLEEALEAFVDGCNVPYQTLWLTESWAAPLFARLRARVRGPVSDDLAVALRQVACKEHRLEDLVAWVEQPEPRAGWAEFAKRCNDAREVAEAVAMRDFLAGQGVNGAPEIGWRLPGWWSFEASRAVDCSPTLCPTCGLPGVQRKWTAAPRNESGLTGGRIVTCPCCQELLDVIAE